MDPHPLLYLSCRRSFGNLFQALEIVSTTYVEPFKVNPCLSNASLMMAKTMMKEGISMVMVWAKIIEGLQCH